MDAGFLAKEAERLSKDPVLLQALSTIKSTAISALVKADPNKVTDVARLQAKVTVCDEFMSELRQMVEAVKVKPRPTIV